MKRGAVELIGLIAGLGACYWVLGASKKVPIHPPLEEPFSPTTVDQPKFDALAITLQPGSQGVVYQALDYQCSPCHRQELEAELFREQNPTVAWKILELPLASHHKSHEMAMTALEADREGKYAAFHAKAMRDLITNDQTIPAFLGPDFHTVADSRFSHLSQDQARLDATKKLGADQTPTFFVVRADGKAIEANTIGAVERFLKPG